MVGDRVEGKVRGEPANVNKRNLWNRPGRVQKAKPGSLRAHTEIILRASRGLFVPLFDRFE